MVGLENVAKTFDRTWDSITNGWRHLIRRASHALTRFYSKDDETEADVTRWGLLSADIFDNDDKVVVTVEAPGMAEADFDITVVDNVLYIKGEKKFEKEVEKGDYTVRERAYGHFERVIPLGYEVDPDSAKATYKHGVLRIEINKSEQHKRRKIQVS